MGQMTRSFPVFRLIGILVAISFSMLVYSCGSDQKAEVAPTTGTGSVAFSVKWEPPPESPPPGSGTAAAARPMAPVVDVCTDYGINSVTMAVFNGPPPPIQEISKPCVENGATLGNIPAGVDNLVLRLTGTPGPWIGDSAFFKLNPNENKDLGIITMGYKGNDNTAPTILSSTPPDNSTNVPNSSVIQIAFSEKMAKNTVIDKDSIVVVDNASNRVPGTTTYNDSNDTATFTPATPFAAVKHTVTVGAMVTDMAGLAMSAPATWSFTVHKKGDWFNPTIIDAGLSGSGNPSLAMNSSGVATVVWEETFDMFIPHIYANRYTTSTGSWETATPLETSNSKAELPKVSMDEAGNATAVWQLQSDMFSYVYFTQFRGGAWDLAEQRVDTAGGDIPTVAMVNTNGSAIFLWRGPSFGDINDNVYYRNWRGEFGIWEGGPYNLYNVYLPLVGVSDTAPKITNVGSGLSNASVWLTSYVDGDICCKRKINAFVNFGAGKPGPHAVIDNDVGGYPAVAVDNSANAVVAWSKLPDGRIYTRRYTRPDPPPNPFGTNASWETAIPISDAPGGFPSIAMNNNGDAVAVWAQNTIYANRYTAGAWGTAAPIGSGAGKVTLPKVAMNASGDAVAVWIQNDEIADSIYANRFSASAGTWGTAVPIESGPGAASSPLVGIDSNGRAVAVWVQNDGTRNRIYSNRTD